MSTLDSMQRQIPPIHKEGYLIARHRERFEPLVKFALPTIEQIEQVHDKGTLAEYCREQGLPIPRTIVPGNPPVRSTWVPPRPLAW